MPPLDWLPTALSGLNLVLILKILLNDLHEIRRLLSEHLRDHWLEKK